MCYLIKKPNIVTLNDALTDSNTPGQNSSSCNGNKEVIPYSPEYDITIQNALVVIKLKPNLINATTQGSNLPFSYIRLHT